VVIGAESKEMYYVELCRVTNVTSKVCRGTGEIVVDKSSLHAQLFL